MLEPISIGILVSIVWGAISYAVAKAKNDEAFEPAKFAKTVLIGIVLASAAQGLGYNITQIEGMSFVGFLTAVIDKVSSLLFKKKKES
jgi:hypothetical protein